jgi:hypothetical protein
MRYCLLLIHNLRTTARRGDATWYLACWHRQPCSSPSATGSHRWQRVASKTGTVVYNSASGAFTTTLNLGSTWASGKYFVKVRLPNTLQQTMGRYSGSTFSIAPSKTTYLPRTPIFTGDINDDNTINILDYNLGSACWFNTASCSPDYAVASDLNDNGTADQVDYTLWLGSTDGASKNCSNGNCVYNSVWGNFGT